MDIKATIFGVEVPIPGIQTNLCEGTVKCPVEKGKTYEGTIVLPVLGIAPIVSPKISLYK